MAVSVKISAEGETRLDERWFSSERTGGEMLIFRQQ